MVFPTVVGSVKRQPLTATALFGCGRTITRGAEFYFCEIFNDECCKSESAKAKNAASAFSQIKCPTAGLLPRRAPRPSGALRRPRSVKIGRGSPVPGATCFDACIDQGW